jgi:hypothetical protein
VIARALAKVVEAIARHGLMAENLALRQALDDAHARIAQLEREKLRGEPLRAESGTGKDGESR